MLVLLCTPVGNPRAMRWLFPVVLLLLGFYYSFAEEFVWRDVRFTDSSNSNLLLHAATSNSYLGKVILLEGRMSMTDTVWSTVVLFTNSYAGTTSMPFWTSNHFFRARVVLP